MFTVIGFYITNSYYGALQKEATCLTSQQSAEMRRETRRNNPLKCDVRHVASYLWAAKLLLFPQMAKKRVYLLCQFGGM